MRFSDFLLVSNPTDLDFIVGYTDEQNIRINVLDLFAGQIIGDGTPGYVPVFTAENVIDDSVIFQHGTNIVIGGVDSLGYKLAVSGSLYASNGAVINSTALGADALRVIAVDGDIFVIPNDLGQSISSLRRIAHPPAVLTTESATLGQLNTAISNLEEDIEILLDLKVDKSSVGEPNGVASLDATGKIPLSEIPDSIIGQVEYMGTWNAFTNTPTLNPLIPEQKGHYYVVSAAGVFGGVDYQVGDWIISNGVEWQKVDNTDAVTSVFGRIGAILALEADYQSFYPRLSQAYDNPTWINTLAFSKITGVPPFLLENQTITLSGDVTGSGKTSIASTISNNAVTDSKLRDSVGTSVIGRASSTTGDPADIQASTDGHVLQRSGGNLLFGLISSDSIGSIDWSKIINTPTTLSGYGITDAYTKTEADNKFVPYTGANANVNLGSNNITANSFVKAGGTSAQFLKADGSVDVSQYVPTTRSVNAGTGLTGGGNLSSDVTLAFDTTWGDTRYAYRTRQLTINGTTYDLSADRIWNVGTVTSVGLSMPSAFTVSNSPIIGSGTLTVVGAGTTSEYVRGDGSLALFPSLTGYVPYNGATQNVNLGEYGLTTGFLGFDLTPTNTPSTPGTMFWSADDETVDIIMDAAVTQKIGQETFYLVKNQTGASIPKGTVVRADGTVGASGRILIAPFLANGTFPSKFCIGVTSETIADGADGFVTAFGKIRQINTASYPEGTVLYASPTSAGGYTSTIPQAPNNIVTVAIVIYSSANNGSIFVRPTFGSSINEDEGVKITSPLLNQGLFYNGGYWVNKTIASALGYTPVNQATTLTINGQTFDLSANRTWSVGTVTSVGLSVPTGFSIGSSPVTTSGTLALTFASGYSLPTNASQSNWDTAYTNRITSLTTTGTSGAATLVSNVLNIPIYQAQGNYITSLTGEATGSGPGAASITLVNSAVTGKVLTGLTVTGSSISATDSILTAFGKLQGQVNDLIGGLQYQGTWNASTNTPTITSGVGTDGHFYIVSVAGNTTIDGVSEWQVGDWIVFHTPSWQKVDNTESVVSVNGLTGAVTLTTSNISEGTNLYFTNARARTAISLTTTGNSGASTYNNGTGVLNVPQYTIAGLGGVPTTRSLTINGTAFDLSADRSWSVGTVTSVATSGPITGGTITGTGTIGITQSGSATDGFLSSTDWNTFNNKQATISLTTNNNSGVSTFIGNVLNVPNYTLSGLGGVPTSRTLTINGVGLDLSTNRSWSVGTVTGTGVAGQVAYWSSSSVITGESNLFWDSVNDRLGISTSNPQYKLDITNGDIRLNMTSGDWGIIFEDDGTLATAGTKIWYGNTDGIQYYDSYWTGAGAGHLFRTNLNGTTQNVLKLLHTGNAVFYNNVTAGSFIRSGGTSSQYLMADGSVSTLTNPVTGTGTTNYLPKFTGASTIGNSLVFDNGTNLGIGTNNPNAQMSGTVGISIFHSSNAALGLSNGINNWLNYLAGTTYRIWNNTSTEVMTFHLNGNVGIGTTSDSGQRLQVNGAVRIFAGNTLALLQPDNGNGFNIRSVNNGDFRLSTGGTPDALIIANAGAATFSSSVTTGGNVTVENLASPRVSVTGNTSTGFPGFNLSNTTQAYEIIVRGNISNAFQIRNTTVSADLVTITSGGNLGLGVTPSAWQLGKSFEINSAGNSIWSYSNDNIYLTQNTVFNSGWKYGTSATAAQYVLFQGQHLWYNAPSGTAGNAITFTQAMTLDASGNLGLGVIPSAWGSSAYGGTTRVIEIGELGSSIGAGAGAIIIGNNWYSTNSAAIYSRTGFPATYYAQNTSSGQHQWYNAPSGTAGNAISFTQAMTLFATGNLLVGTPSPISDNGARLQVSGTATVSGQVTAATFLTLSEDGTYTGTYYTLGFSGKSNGANRIFGARDGSDGLYIASATSRDIYFRAGGGTTNNMTITSGGNLGIGIAPAQRLHVNGGSLLVNTGTSATAFRDIMMGGISGWTTNESHGIDTVYGGADSPTTFSRIESHFDGTSGRIRFRNLFNDNNPRTSILMTIRGNGNVGIGEDSPTNLLHLVGASATPSLRLGSTSAGFHYDIGRENAVTGDFLINGTASGVSQGTLFRINANNFTVTTAGTVNARNTSTSASLNTPAVLGGGEFMSTGGVAGYFWENRSGGVTSNSNWYGWYTTAGVINLWNGGGNLLSINGTSGAATFSSSVTAGGLLSTQYASAGSTMGAFIVNTAASTLNNSADLWFGTWGGSTIAGITNARISALNVNAGNAATDLLFYTFNGSSSGERMRITSGGNVGIGTPGPSQLLHLYTNLATSSGVGTAMQITSDGAGGDNAWIGVNKGSGNGLEFSVENRDIIFNTGATTPFGGTERMRITSGGDVYLNNAAALFFGPTSVTYLTGSTTTITFAVNDSPRMSIFSDGNVLIQSGGTFTNNGARLQVSGNSIFTGSNAHNIIRANGGDYCYLYLDNQAGPSARHSYFIQNTSNSTANNVSAGAAYMYFSQGQQMEFNWGSVSRIQFTSAGQASFAGDVIAFASSDRRLKDNIVNIENPLQKISKIGGYSFTWNSNQETYSGKDYGVVAQEIEDIFPELVRNRDNGYKAVKYEKLIPLLIESIKELNKKVELLELK